MWRALAKSVQRQRSKWSGCLRAAYRHTGLTWLNRTRVDMGRYASPRYRR